MGVANHLGFNDNMLELPYDPVIVRKMNREFMIIFIERSYKIIFITWK